MLIPFVHYNLATCMTAFVLLGIGNTILQVSLNPLLTNVVKGDALTSSLTAGQVVKAVSSFSAAPSSPHSPPARWATGNPLPDLRAHHAALGRMAHVHPIREDGRSAAGLACRCARSALLKDRTVLLLFLGIVFVVGVDVGMNTVAPSC